jgi:hypothetical protein
MKPQLLFALCVSLCIAVPAAAQPPLHLASASTPQPFPAFQFAVPQQDARVHVLLVGDTNDPKIGQSAAVDLDNLASLFHELVPDRQLQMQILRGDDVNKANILRTINTFRPAVDDAFVFIWSGHGAYNNGGHYFCLAGGDGLHRADIVTAMRRLGPRLVVVLSGSCNEVSQSSVQRVYRPHVCVYPVIDDKPQSILPIAEALFLKPRGTVDINGASEGELAFGNSQRGCSFIYPLKNYLRENSGQRVSWQTLVGDITPRVQEMWDEAYPKGYIHEITQKTYTKQTPRVWALPDDGRGARFGVGATNNDGNGVRVVEVWSDYPGTRMVSVATGERCVLEPNDVILTINGQPVRCIHEYDRAVKTSPQQMVLAVRNCRDGRVGLLAATLRY